MFDGFALDRVDVGDAVLRVRHGGSGPPVLLLHGHPRTHATWHRVAPRLAASCTVVCPDLRGYGRSSGPPSTPDHSAYSKRAMAGDSVRLMRQLGHDRFVVVGHDRGSYVAMRTALDHPDAVAALGVLDSVPIGEALARADARFAAAWWHWFFLGQTAKPAERVINADPDAWYAGIPRSWARRRTRTSARPCTTRRWCTRCARTTGPGSGPTGPPTTPTGPPAGGSGARRWCCGPAADDLAYLYGDVLGVWRAWADDLRGGEIDSGHHMAEEAPEQLAAALHGFLAEVGWVRAG